MKSGEHEPSGAAPPVEKGECPVCGKPSTPEASPFCSKRCQNVDLNRWLSGRYVIPGRTGPSDSDEAED